MNCSRIALGILEGPIAEALGAATPTDGRIVGCTPDDDIPEVWRRDAAHYELDEIVMVEPSAQVTELGGPLQSAPNAEQIPSMPRLSRNIRAIASRQGLLNPSGPNSLAARAFICFMQRSQVVLDAVRQRPFNTHARLGQLVNTL
jgi:hypothetical protein